MSSGDSVDAEFRNDVNFVSFGTGFNPPGSHKASIRFFSYVPSDAPAPVLPDPIGPLGKSGTTLEEEDGCHAD